jgi:hypothetical protein
MTSSTGPIGFPAIPDRAPADGFSFRMQITAMAARLSYN